MANRHSNKRLRRAIRDRMQATGEGYQAARAALLDRPDPASPAVDAPPVAELIPLEGFGRPAALAVLSGPGRGTVLTYVLFGAGPVALPPRASLHRPFVARITSAGARR